jgi:hypothetical protein
VYVCVCVCVCVKYMVQLANYNTGVQNRLVGTCRSLTLSVFVLLHVSYWPSFTHVFYIGAGIVVNDVIASEPASERIRREHHVIISDQEMNERVGTGGLMGRDQGEGTDDTWVASHHAQRTQYPTTADPGVDLTGEQVWH